jgi:hypothetical protein
MQMDATGTFAFSEVVPSPYVLRVALDGYAPDERQIDLAEDTRLVVGLRPAIDLKGLITAVQALEAQTLSRFNTAVSTRVPVGSAATSSHASSKRNCCRPGNAAALSSPN